MSRVRVKICGITSLKELKIATKAGADAVGFVVGVPESPRNLSIIEAQKLIESTPIFVESVAVTVPVDLKNLKNIYEKLNPSALQVHGILHLHEGIREEISKACLIGGLQARSEETFFEMAKKISENFDAILLDSYDPDKYGGTGKTHDWTLAESIKKLIYPKPLILAGGLNQDNVRDAILKVRPLAVDVSSGVESFPGKKDPDKIFEFIKRVKEVDL